MRPTPVRAALALLALALAACADPAAPTARPSLALSAPDVFARYVAIGTSNSQGVQSAGNTAATQRAAWPAQLAARAGASFSLPLFQDPGCTPPLAPPLAYDFALIAAYSAFGMGDDLVTTVSNTCAPLQDGIVPPTNNVAISGADVHDILYTTIDLATLRSPRIGTLYSRILAPGQTQVTAMRAESPTFVSVEAAANDVLPATTGRISAMTPYANWASAYDSVVAAVKATGARAVLVGLPRNAAQFPSIRRGNEFFNEWDDMLAMGVTVSWSCSKYGANGGNYLFIPGYVLTLLSKSPTTATCADVPGAVDYVLTPSDISAINARMSQMNQHIQAVAAANGYAYFALSALYDLPKINFDMYHVMFSDTPFGSHMSLDGVHPSAYGQRILADTAAAAINARYGTAIP